MINATTGLGRALQRIRLIAKLQNTEKFLREHNRHDDADAVRTSLEIINGFEPEFTVEVETGCRSVSIPDAESACGA